MGSPHSSGSALAPEIKQGQKPTRCNIQRLLYNYILYLCFVISVSMGHYLWRTRLDIKRVAMLAFPFKILTVAYTPSSRDSLSSKTKSVKSRSKSYFCSLVWYCYFGFLLHCLHLEKKFNNELLQKNNFGAVVLKL